MGIIIRFSPPDSISWQFGEKGCFACNGIKRLKQEQYYQCGVLYRIQCWLSYLDIPFEMNPKPGTCLMIERGACQGEFVCEFH